MSYSTVQLRRGMMLGASALALCLSAPAFAQTQAKDDEQTEEEDPGITVTGLRQSLASAQSIKVNSDQFVDSVTSSSGRSKLRQ